MKLLLVLLATVSTFKTAEATAPVSVKLSDVPATRVQILNDNEYMSRRNCTYTNDKPSSQVQLGQTFIPARNFKMDGLCLQLSSGGRPLRNADNQKFEISIFHHTARDSKPETVLKTYQGRFPKGISGRLVAHKWLQFDFDNGIDLKAKNNYGFLIGFAEPSAALISIACSNSDNGTYTDGWFICRRAGTFTAFQEEDLEFAILGAVDPNQFDAISDDEINLNAGPIKERAYKRLQQFGNWQTDELLKEKHADEIAAILLVIAKANRAQQAPVNQVKENLYDLIKQFPHSQHTVTALLELIELDEKTGWEYALDFLSEKADSSKTISFFKALIKNSLVDDDCIGLKKYLKCIFDMYHTDSDGSMIMVRLLDDIGLVEDSKALCTALREIALTEPNSQTSWVICRYITLKFSPADNLTEFLKWLQSVRDTVPGTKLAYYAAAVHADYQYEKGDFVRVLLAFKPCIFAEHQSESDIIKAIDETLKLYQVNTLRAQGVDISRIYKEVARYNQNLDRNLVAVYCYRKITGIKIPELGIFERIAPDRNALPADDEIWFWKGLLAAQEGDFAAASIAYKRFLNANSTSILFAKACYDLAQANTVSGKYTKAKNYAEVARASVADANTWQSFGNKALYFLGSGRCPAPDWLKHQKELFSSFAKPDSHKSVNSVKVFLARAFRNYQQSDFAGKGRILLDRNPQCILGLYLADKFPRNKLGRLGRQIFVQSIERSLLIVFGADEPWLKKLQTYLLKADKTELFNETELPFLLIYLTENGSCESIRQRMSRQLAKYLEYNYGLEPALRQYRVLLSQGCPDISPSEKLRITSQLKSIETVPDANSVYGNTLSILREKQQNDKNVSELLSKMELIDNELFLLFRELRNVQSKNSQAALTRYAAKVCSGLTDLGKHRTYSDSKNQTLGRLLFKAKKHHTTNLLLVEYNAAVARLRKQGEPQKILRIEPLIFTAQLLCEQFSEDTGQVDSAFVFDESKTEQMYRFAVFARQMGQPFITRMALNRLMQKIDGIGSNNINLLQRIAETYLDTNDYKKALETYDRIIEYSSDDKNAEDARFNIIKLYAERLRLYDNAVGQCRQFLENFPQSQKRSQVEFLIGKFAYLNKDYATAVRQLDKFQKDYPDDSNTDKAMTLAALSRMFQGKSDNAVKRFMEIIRKHPGSDLAARSRFLIGYTQLCDRQYSQAIKTFTQLIEQFPKSGYADRARGFIKRLTDTTL